MSQRKEFENVSANLSGDDVDNEMITSALQSGVKKYDVVIVGAGLGGLTAALEASNAGKSVLVIESRQKKYAAIRPQLIFLKLVTKEYLNSHYLTLREKGEDKGPNLFGGLKYYARHFGIKDIQQYLLRLIGSSCQFQYEAMISEINLDEGLLQVSTLTNPPQHETIKFEHLVIADGAKRRTANLLQPKIEYNAVADRPEKKHIMAYFNVETKDELPVNYIGPAPLVMLRYENCAGYLYYEERVEKKNNKWILKVCVVMHVTDEEYDIYKSNDALGVRFLTHCAESVFPSKLWNIERTASKKTGLEKDRLKFAAFELDFVEVSTPAFVRNGNKVLFVGDARRSPDFYLGHGGNDAILDGQLAGGVIKGIKTIAEYNNECRKRSKEVSLETSSYQPIVDKVDANTLMNCSYSVPKFVNPIQSVKSELRQPLDEFGFFSFDDRQVDSVSDEEEAKMKLRQLPQ